MTASSRPKQTLQDVVKEARLTHDCQNQANQPQPHSIRLTGEPAEPDPVEISMFLNLLVSITIQIASEQDKDKKQWKTQ